MAKLEIDNGARKFAVDMAEDEAALADVDRLLNEALRIALAAPTSIVSDVVSWHGHIPFAQALVATARPRVVVELGVHKGDSYRALVDAMARYGVEGRAFGVDSWRGDEHAGSYDGEAILEDVRSRNEPYSGFSTLLRKTFEEGLSDFDDGTIDLLHIDGFHTYEAVRGDYENWLPKLSSRALVLFHDTAVRYDDFGVYRFWDEVSAGRLSYAFEHSNGLGVLCVGDNIDHRTRLLVELLQSRPVGQVAPAKLFETIGEAYAGRIAAAVFKGLYEAKDSEARAIQTAAMAEIERLNAEIVVIRTEGQAALDHAEARVMQAHQKAAADSQLARTTADTGVVWGETHLITSEISETRRLLSEELVGTTAEIGAVKQETHQIAVEISETRRLLTEELAGTTAEIGAVKQETHQIAVESSEAQRLLSEELGRLTAGIDAIRGEMHRIANEVSNTPRLFSEEFSRLNSGIERAAVAAGQEVHNFFDKQSRRSSLSGRAQHARRAAKALGIRLVKASGRTVINLLPISTQAKNRLKYRLIARHGHLVGFQIGRRSYDTSSWSQVALHNVSGRYLDIARSATGAPTVVPPHRVSVIIPVHNQLAYTLRCLDSIRRNTGEVEYEVIVVDDCSSDETPIELSQRDDIVFLRNQQNLGFIRSCNAGLKRASKDYVLFLNNDTEVGPRWLSTMVNSFELNSHLGMVGSKLIYPNGSLQEAGGIIWDDFSGWNWGRGKDAEDPRFNYARQVDYCSGASLMLPRALAIALGGFDPEFAPAYGEDSDLAFRIRLLGLSVLYQPLSQVIHHEGVSSGTDVTKGIKAYQIANAEKLAKRWAPVLAHQSPNGRDPDLAADGGRLGRVLVIDQITPEPDRDAGSITSLELMRTLHDFGYKITFIPCSNFTNMPDYTDTLAALGIESVLYPWTKSVREHLEHFGRHYSAVVIFRFNSATEHLDTVRELAPQAKVIYHTSDLHFLREERARKVDNSGIPERSHAFMKTKAAELSIIGKSDVTVLHSHYEQDLLAELAPGKPVVVFPWIYQPRGAGRPARDRRDIVFLGGYRHYPNVDAVLHFVHDILPLVLRSNPDIIFHAVGSNPPAEIVELASANMRVPGFVHDVSPFLWSARMMVAPLRYGAGIKGKIVTAMAHGLPVITTTIGAEGMGLTDGINVIIADAPQEMTAAIERLNSDNVLWNTLCKGGLEYVARTTSRDVGYDIVESILRQVGLPALPRPKVARERYAHAADFGSPTVLFLPATLLAAAGDTARGGLLLVSPELAGCAIEGWRVVSLSEAVAGQAERLVAIVDGSDERELAKLASDLPKWVAAGGSASIVFAPPRLVLSGGTYAVQRPFSAHRAPTPIRPPHLQYAGQLAKLGGKLSWRSDATTLGFPGLMVADWQPATR